MSMGMKHLSKIIGAIHLSKFVILLLHYDP